MSMLTITVDDSGAVRVLADIQSRALSYRPVLERARLAFGAMQGINFATQGSLSGGWAPLTPEYGAWKAVHYPGVPTLVQTGELMRSLTTLHGPANRVDSHEAQFGTSVEYAKFHEHGTSRMLARKLIFDSPEFVQALEEDSKNHLLEGPFTSIGNLMALFL